MNASRSARYLERIHSIPYTRGIPEYAIEVQKTFHQMKGKDFILAVDLPHGLEPEVLKAVKRLPKPTLILDTLKRGILVIPSCAAIEAVRSFSEGGTEYHFIDSSLPVSSTPGEWRRFADYCREFGQSEIFEHAEEYGVNLQAMILPRQEHEAARPFLHLAGSIGSIPYTGLIPSLISEYFEARQRYMAMRLQQLMEKDLEIIFVCNQRHWGRVMEYLKEPQETFEDPFRLPTVSCRLKADDLAKVSPEIPWFIGLYERWRTEGFSRKDALIDLLVGDGIDQGVRIAPVFTYAMNLALSEAQLYPDLYSILIAAQTCGNDNYAYSVFQRAQQYPYDNMESNCRLREYYTYDFEETGIRKLSLRPSFPPDWSDDTGGKKRNKTPPWGVFNFVRTDASKQAEREFMRYLESRYVAKKPSASWNVQEFCCGLKDGIDCRETLRPQPVPKIFVREQALVNSAAYVVNFGGIPTWRAYFDTQYHIVGAARREGVSRHTWVCFTAFLAPPGRMEPLLNEIDFSDPLYSCVSLATEYADHVFLFTDLTRHPAVIKELPAGVKVYDIQNIPSHLKEAMRWFHVV